MAAAGDEQPEIFKLGDFPLSSGLVLRDAHIAYKTLGDPSLPLVIYPTWYSGKIADNLWLAGEDKTLSPKSFFIVVPALFGNGESTSPSNSPANLPFPAVSFYDNVRAQHALVTERLGLRHARAVLGWSMGAAQTYQWSTQYPDFVDLAIPFCGSAKTSLHNKVFLEGVKAALLAPKGLSSAGIDVFPQARRAGLSDAGELVSQRQWTPAERDAGLRALGRVYAGWGFSQTFYRERLFVTAPTLGSKDLEDFMVGFWEGWALSKDPENMLAMLHTWQTGDVSLQEPYRGDFEAAMRAIKAKMLVLPGKTDLYFPPEDSEYEVSCMAPGVGRCEAFPSQWGHWAGNWHSVEDVTWLDKKLKDFFDEHADFRNRQ